MGSNRILSKGYFAIQGTVLKEYLHSSDVISHFRISNYAYLENPLGGIDLVEVLIDAALGRVPQGKSTRVESLRSDVYS